MCNTFQPSSSLVCSKCGADRPLRLVDPHMLSALMILLVAAAAVGAIVWALFFRGDRTTRDVEEGVEIEACVERGIAYFKEIGSYPTLTSSVYEGRNADEEARERC